MNLRYLIIDLDEQRVASRESMSYFRMLKRAKTLNAAMGRVRYVAIMVRP